MRIRKLIVFAAPIVLLLVFADPALAVTHGGEGLYGATDDVSITNTMFILLGFFPALIIVMSLYQAWSERRRHEKVKRRKAAETAAHANDAGW